MLRAPLGLSVEVLRSRRFLRRRRAHAGSRPPGGCSRGADVYETVSGTFAARGSTWTAAPQQARASMSNHDETRKTDVLRSAEAMRGATRAPTRARRRARPRRMLRGEQHRGTFDRIRPVCDESVTACVGFVQIQQRCRVTSWRGAWARGEREYVVAVDSREYPPTLPCGGSRW
jgi:hypothetical protein